MTSVEIPEKINTDYERKLFSYFPVFSQSIYEALKKSVSEFFAKKYEIRFIGATSEENILYWGDEYFVNKIPVNKNSEIKINISSNVINTLLNDTLGTSENKFSLKRLSDLEALLIKDFTLFVYENLEPYINKTEVNLKFLKDKKNCGMTFYLRKDKQHCGKIIINIPEYILNNLKIPEKKQIFTISDFKNTAVTQCISAGSSKISLNDLKLLEDGDIIVLDKSSITEMSVILNGKTIPFKVKPEPSLVLGINGGDEMEEEITQNPQNMWDSILVDVVAEFDNVKMTLGELKQISEGLVIDVGSVYDEKIKLKVENKTVATGELVIINDRYGVRITNVVKQHTEEKKAAPEKPAKPAPTASQPKVPVQKKPVTQQAAPAKKPVAPQPKAPAQNKAGDENFDYRDFDIKDESI